MELLERKTSRALNVEAADGPSNNTPHASFLGADCLAACASPPALPLLNCQTFNSRTSPISICSSQSQPTSSTLKGELTSYGHCLSCIDICEKSQGFSTTKASPEAPNLEDLQVSDPFDLIGNTNAVLTISAVKWLETCTSRKMGRKPNAIVLEHFDRGAKLNDNSNRW